MKPLPWMPVYVKDMVANANVATMTLEEKACFAWTLFYLWENDGHLPFDRLHILHGVSPSRWRVIWKTIGPRFKCVDGKVFHERTLASLAEARTLHETAVLKGAKGGHAKAARARGELA